MCKFRIRDLLWLTLVLSVTLGWWIHQSRLSTRATEAEMRAQHLEGVMNQGDIQLGQDRRLS